MPTRISISRFAAQRPDYRQEHVIATRTHHFHQEGSDTAFHRCRWEGDELTLAALSDADCPEQLELHTLLKASIQQLSTVPSATVRAKDDAEHAAHISKRELELDAATMFTASDSDSASTRLSLGRKQTWCEDKLRRGHVGTAFHYI